LNYYCSKGKECGFALWKSTKLLESMKVSVTPARAKKILADRRVFIKGLYSQKKDAKFDAFLIYEDTGKFVNYKLEFGKG
jgi:DNA topoisomerase-3